MSAMSFASAFAAPAAMLLMSVLSEYKLQLG